ncbi:hydroxylamine reductase [Paramaledivibacter caminithermalis]|uniref:Hydroxylamine reductase n=1 Tax=Paramaledivibacter caminithermalis (strain DSM 15212 / CIP 107654 / DViRD3) TaxID=1121301 RepID=A0A1M6RDL7_PARC5|nr:hydroxylamine reductase [Paramaledivibacter caminithermalis]SHK30532.1 hydroxylamine reductase [Paramaledivibacter caminithermalis DSM 15212]
MENMFCFQCQEAAGGKGCSRVGVCGKKPETAGLQDTLIYTLKGISYLIEKGKAAGVEIRYADDFVMDSLFMTITNANFDDSRFVERIKEALKIRNDIKEMLISKDVSFDETLDVLVWTGNTVEEIKAKGKNEKVGVLATENEDIRSLRELITYGVKGLAAYAHHAYNLGEKSKEIFDFMHKALAALLDDTLSIDDLVALTLETGKYGVDTMALLDKANTSKYGNPEITEVNIGVNDRPAILISGHDLHDLEELLIQTENTGVDVYTHCEMLPAHYYPAFKKYPHFIGNYGNAWWKQNEEFESFNGPILMTTNCIVPPKGEVVNRIFTTGAAGYPGCKHIEAVDGKKDFSEIIELAKTLPAPTEIETGKIVGGFAHAQVFALADKVVDAVKSGAIKKFFVMAGCDGRMKSRDYYREFAEKLPKDTVILTAGCAKYRYNKLNLGDIGGIPRILDAGQCNDSYSLAVIALKLKEVFELEDVNELPIAYNIAWYEQKAVIVLLALLYLGVKNIHLGPTLPAFLSPNVAKVLVDTFGIGGIGTVEDDIEMFLS